MAGPKRK
jgi:transposase